MGIGEKGIFSLKLKSSGTPAHASMAQYKGENAILKMGKILPILYELTRGWVRSWSMSLSTWKKSLEEVKSTLSPGAVRLRLMSECP